MREELINYVFEKSGEICLSNLRIPAVLKECIPFIMKINNEEYSIKEWHRLYTYLCGKQLQTDSIQEIKQALTNWIKGK